MKKRLITQTLTWALALAGTGIASGAELSRVYVEFKPGQKNEAKALLQRAGGQVHHEFDTLNAVATSLPTAALAGIRNNPNVVLVEDDPPRFLFGCSLPTEQIPYGLDLVQATDIWDTNTDGELDPGAPTGAGIKVGIIDSGVFAGHSDFAGVTFSGSPSGSYPLAWNTDRNGHGTHVTGTIAAAVNDSGVVGVSPGVSIHMVKVFGDAGQWIYSSTLLNAAKNCQSAGCKIISMSLGGPGRSVTEDRGFQQLYSAGILLVAAAGNAGDNTTSYPAGYSSVISVAAVDANKAVASFSQKNSTVELAAPGVGVLSTVPYCEENTVTVAETKWAGNHIEFAARGSATGLLVNGGRATTTDPAWDGMVVLVERGDISFYDKVRNVQLSGGVACLIYNNVPGEDLYATLGDGNSSTIPAIGLSQANGQALLAQVGQNATVTSMVTYETSAWAEYDGTSMATPHVSAVAALIWSAAPGKSNANIRQALQVTAEDLGTAGRDNSYGYGLVRAKAALDYLIPSGDTTPPVISNVADSVVNAKKGTFKVTWTTDEPATTVVMVGGKTFSNTTLVTAHSITVTGTKGTTYYVSSTDAAGNTEQAGPFTL